MPFMYYSQMSFESTKLELKYTHSLRSLFLSTTTESGILRLCCAEPLRGPKQSPFRCGLFRQSDPTQYEGIALFFGDHQ